MASSRRQYPFHLIEPKWQQSWDEQQVFRAFNPGETLPAGHPFAQRHGLEGKKPCAAELPPKFYILDMFPYPSGAGLHVGHPEGYTATDILARYKRAQGFHVLHPMGWDAFGLPAEQYAIKTGQHPRQTTEANIATFKRQIQSLGFSYDWSRELATTDTDYFKWTQWIFLKLYNSWFNPETNRVEPIETLKYPRWCKNEKLKNDFRVTKRLAYVAKAPVWWCEQLGTVLANEEVVDGKSEVGGFPVVRMYMRQWMLRITKYAERLLNDLDTIDWSDSLKQMQRNWIGKSEGAYVAFKLEGSITTEAQNAGGQHESDPDPIEFSIDDELFQAEDERELGSEPIWVFTTRPDTLFGATYMVLSPEHKLVEQITTPDQKKAVKDYKTFAASKSDLERTELAKEKTGVFTGAYAINPVNGEKIPIWIADYVLASYGTGAIMAVPAHDERDFEFAKKFKLSIRAVVKPSAAWALEHGKRIPLTDDIANLKQNFSDAVAAGNWGAGLAIEKIIENGFWTPQKASEALLGIFPSHPELFDATFVDDGYGINSQNSEIDLNGLPTPEAKKKITGWLEAKRLGKKTINYKLRDWLFSRQRYWGEPFPIVHCPHCDTVALSNGDLPLQLPEMNDYRPSATGEPPLSKATEWVNMRCPICGMLAKRETNTMPQWAGSCWYYLRFLDAKNSAAFVSKEAESYWMGTSKPSTLNPQPSTKSTPGVDLYVGGTEHAVLHLLYARFWHKVLYDLGHVSTPEPFFKLVNQGLILGEDGQKMSKSRGNVVNPDDILEEFGADAFRLYEMFMGPLEMVKPWSTQGVAGVYKFLGRVWRLFVDEQSETEFEQAETTAPNADKLKELLGLIKLSSAIKDVPPTPAQLKTLHTCIKKVTEDLDDMRFNTAISAMMVFTNDAITWETKPASVLRDFLILLAPFAPHLAEELWAKLSTLNSQPSTSLTYAPWPKFDPELLVEDTLEIPVQVNGKLRDVIKIAANADNATVEAAAKASEKVQQFIAGKTIKKVIIVPKKLVNLVVG